MNNKLFILAILVLSILPMSFLQAKKKVITLTQLPASDINQSQWQRKERSITGNKLFVLHDKDIFYIYSDNLIEEVKLTIRNRHNDIIYSTIEPIFSDKENIFELNIGYGEYVIELEYKETVYYGYFEITE